MAITTDKPVTPEQTAQEYAIKFRKPLDEETVKWVREHQKEYLELVRSKDEIARENKIDTDKFIIQMRKADEPNLDTDVAATVLHRYMKGAANPEANPGITNVVTINTGSFTPGLTTADRKAFEAHEMGHQLAQNSPEVNTDQFMKHLGDSISMFLFKPAKNILPKTEQEIKRDDEFRADKVGAALLHSSEQMATALEHLGKLPIKIDGQALADSKGHVYHYEDVQGGDHPTIPDRIAALRDPNSDTPARPTGRKK